MSGRFDGPADAPEPSQPGDIYPGVYPFTRGIQPTMYRGRLWTMRQYAGFGTAAESNARYRYLLDQGVSGLSVAFDLPTQMGYDSDHPLAEGEVGRVGVAIDSVDDMAALFEGLPLDRISASMTINATASIILAFYVALAEERGLAPSTLTGTIQNDILKEYIARGTEIFPPGPSLRLVTDTLAWCERHVPRWHPISVSGYHMREAGSTAVQEVAFTLANAITYIEAARAAGLDVDRLGQRLSFFFASHSNFLEEIAKFRAARRLWATLAKDRLGLTSPGAQQLRFHAQTAGSTLTAQQPDNNVVRVTVQALAAVLGGAQSLHCNGKDEALALPTAEAAQLALRTQQIIAFETGVPHTVDPVGGSWTIERLTTEIEAGACQLIDAIDRQGGMLQAIASGFVRRHIEEAAYATQVAIDTGAQPIVGQNTHTTTERATIPTLRIDPSAEARQKASVGRLRRTRDAAAVPAALGAVREAARGRDNLMPVILAAAHARATLGEIADTLRSVFGEQHDHG